MQNNKGRVTAENVLIAAAIGAVCSGIGIVYGGSRGFQKGYEAGINEPVHEAYLANTSNKDIPLLVIGKRPERVPQVMTPVIVDELEDGETMRIAKWVGNIPLYQDNDGLTAMGATSDMVHEAAIPYARMLYELTPTHQSANDSGSWDYSRAVRNDMFGDITRRRHEINTVKPKRKFIRQKR